MNIRFFIIFSSIIFYNLSYAQSKYYKIKEIDGKAYLSDYSWGNKKELKQNFIISADKISGKYILIEKNSRINIKLPCNKEIPFYEGSVKLSELKKYCEENFGLFSFVMGKVNEFYKSLVSDEDENQYSEISAGIKGFGKKDLNIICPYLKLSSRTDGDKIKLSLNHLNLKWEDKNSQKFKIYIYDIENRKKIYYKKVKNKYCAFIPLEKIDLKYGKNYKLIITDSNHQKDILVFKYYDINDDENFQEMKKILPENRGSFDYVIKLAYVYNLNDYYIDAQTLILDYLKNFPENKSLNLALKELTRKK